MVKLYYSLKDLKEGGEGDQQQCLQHNPEKTKYRCCSPEIDAAVEGRRSYKGVRSR